MNVQELMEEVKTDMRMAYGEDAVRNLVIEGNTFTFEAYHDDGDIKCTCNDAKALLDMMDGKHLGQQLMIFWDTITVEPINAD